MTIRFALIGQRISHHRRRLKMTQLQLATLVGVGERTMGKIEKGFDMRLSVVMAIADALKVPVAELLDYEQAAPLTLSAHEQQKIAYHLKAIKDLLL
ncbi:helix-turn-helix domain-containing protein [Shewanella sp.]|uniref:helix-turn-helix domain-containing protein n=1 Tax=Shewanella sp. TaxID=50422 RepID=UPI003A97CE40